MALETSVHLLAKARHVDKGHKMSGSLIFPQGDHTTSHVSWEGMCYSLTVREGRYLDLQRRKVQESLCILQVM